MDAKEMNKMHFVHIFDVYSTVIYRLSVLVPRLDVTVVISYNNGYDEKNSNPIKRFL